MSAVGVNKEKIREAVVNMFKVNMGVTFQIRSTGLSGTLRS